MRRNGVMPSRRSKNEWLSNLFSKELLYSTWLETIIFNYNNYTLDFLQWNLTPRKWKCNHLWNKSENISLLEKETLFTLFKINFYFKRVKSHFKKKWDFSLKGVKIVMLFFSRSEIFSLSLKDCIFTLLESEISLQEI